MKKLREIWQVLSKAVKHVFSSTSFHFCEKRQDNRFHDNGKCDVCITN